MKMSVLASMVEDISMMICQGISVAVADISMMICQGISALCIAQSL